MSDLNDPRVFFAAERTLLAWNRTGVALVAFGFVIERFGLFVHMLRQLPGHPGRDISFWIGIAFIALAVAVITFSVVQYRRVLATLKPIEIPERYNTWSGVAMNLAVMVLAVTMIAYLFTEF